MRKIIMAAVAAASLAPLAVPALASADVQRYQTETATFTATQPDGIWNDWSNQWNLTFNVDVNPCTNTFSGTDLIVGAFGETPMNERVTGSFNSDGTISWVANRDNGAFIWSQTKAKTDGSINTAQRVYYDGVMPDYAILQKVTAPVVTSTSNYKNHGDYVSAMGGGADAAHSCIGMPINSSN